MRVTGEKQISDARIRSVADVVTGRDVGELSRRLWQVEHSVAFQGLVQ